jgi:hypothetical protein
MGEMTARVGKPPSLPRELRTLLVSYNFRSKFLQSSYNYFSQGYGKSLVTILDVVLYIVANLLRQGSTHLLHNVPHLPSTITSTVPVLGLFDPVRRVVTPTKRVKINTSDITLIHHPLKCPFDAIFRDRMKCPRDSEKFYQSNV